FISNKAATLAEMLRATGYNTYALGKWHLTNMEDCTPAGPFSQWPLQRGFDRYYGFLGGATDQFSPELVVDNHPIDPPSDAGYHLSEDLVNEAIGMLSAQRSAAPDRPFFLYLAFGATHSPHQAPQAYLDKYKGRYDKGWDVTRQEWFARQLELGIVPEGAQLSPRNPGVLPWDELSDDQRRLYARMQEAFAGFMDHTDDQIGRLVEFLSAIDALDNTLLLLLSDNGASQEGGRDGMLNELVFFNRLRPSVEDMVEHIDLIGGPNLYNNYPRGWAQVGNTPLRFYKQDTYEGGIRDPLIVHWPKCIHDKGGMRTQYHHVIDVLPTVLECVGIEAPDTFNGVPQLPVEGISFAYTFASPDHIRRRRVQYYEMLGHRALWADGWKAVTRHRHGQSFDDDQWALYHTDADFSECHDLADAQPEKLRELIERWWAEAGRYNVLPLDDRGIELFVQRRPSAGGERRQFRFLPGAPHIDRFAVPDIRNRSHRMMARIARDSTQQQGVLVASGARTGGYVLYILDNRLIYEYNYVGRVTRLVSDRELPPDACDLGMQFSKSGEHVGTVTLLVDDTEVGKTSVELLPWRQTMYGMDIGRDQGSTVSSAYAAPFRFDGRLFWVDYHLEDDREDGKKAATIEARNALTDQ
ncbi:MAG: arylsulfatase, partial [Candidatus Tectomicrobia bacterium]